ncbi:rhamnulose-1-phosphate aldolase [Saccharibacillus sp. CPCC 101409]|uniref:rhamnulose-1-phosphate aldolase n=1 Tax=Saccharibacillus sp. CPCC 101409 TaxID=3058041 RepID=UPI002671B24A|nr:rhamnulose-1-phosphate aldolase [Saccharibacillus sp. CPCC 101409]MDO3408862.1 rhamnulose-1-phosphate aldolase [Saccharibacillus sp. CPCC 101409]
MSTSVIRTTGYTASTEAPFIQEMAEITHHMWTLGWDELNGGNVSYLLDEEEVSKYINVGQTLRSLDLAFPVKELAGKYFIVTGSGKYFRNVIKDPEGNLGVVRVSASGEQVDILWGLREGARPTSELASHFMSHIERLKVDPTHRIVLHTHATNVIAMTFTHDLDELKFTKTLWQMCTECLVVFPDGVGILPWIVPGSNEIGRETAKKMQEQRVVIWPHHGIFGTGSTMDSTFGLIETVEKAANVYNLIGGREIKQVITDHQLDDLARAFGVTPKAGILEL